MAQKNKKNRIRFNPNQINAMIARHLDRKYSYIEPQKGMIQFVVPKINSFSFGIAHNQPLAKVNALGKLSPHGKIDRVKYYYIPKSEYNQVVSYLKEFELPNENYNDLIWAFLNMVFASCESTHSNVHAKKFRSEMDELYQLMDFVEKIVSNKITLEANLSEYRESPVRNNKNNQRVRRPVKTLTVKNNIAVNWMTSILKNYDKTENYNAYKKLYDEHKTAKPFDQYYGHMNAEKHFQSYYCSTLFSIVCFIFFKSAFDLLGDEKAFNAEVKRLKKIHPLRKIYLFIGKLMTLSGLMKIKSRSENDDIINNVIIENIEKKLLPMRRANKKNLKSMHEAFRNSKDQGLVAPSFGYII